MVKSIKKNIERIWCAGCGLYLIENVFASILEKEKFNMKNSVIVSGIGCSSRMSGYFNIDGVHTTHGRAIPVAEGVKIANPKLNVIVFSGDGDLLGIGFNHLIHTARRNTAIKVFCNRNDVYGMTGGQLAPTTPIGGKTKTTLYGNTIEPINVESTITCYKNVFYGKAYISDPQGMYNVMKKSLDWKGFSFVEIFSICHTNYGRLQGFNSPAEMILEQKKDLEKK